MTPVRRRPPRPRPGTRLAQQVYRREARFTPVVFARAGFAARVVDAVAECALVVGVVAEHGVGVVLVGDVGAALHPTATRHPGPVSRAVSSQNSTQDLGSPSTPKGTALSRVRSFFSSQRRVKA